MSADFFTLHRDLAVAITNFMDLHTLFKFSIASPSTHRLYAGDMGVILCQKLLPGHPTVAEEYRKEITESWMIYAKIFVTHKPLCMIDPAVGPTPSYVRLSLDFHHGDASILVSRRTLMVRNVSAAPSDAEVDSIAGVMGSAIIHTDICGIKGIWYVRSIGSVHGVLQRVSIPGNPTVMVGSTGGSPCITCDDGSMYRVQIYHVYGPCGSSNGYNKLVAVCGPHATVAPIRLRGRDSTSSKVVAACIIHDTLYFRQDDGETWGASKDGHSLWGETSWVRSGKSAVGFYSSELDSATQTSPGCIQGDSWGEEHSLMSDPSRGNLQVYRVTKGEEPRHNIIHTQDVAYRACINSHKGIMLLW